MHHRSNPWAYWLKRYDKEGGLKGLKDRTKTGRSSELPEETSYQFKQELESNRG